MVSALITAPLEFELKLILQEAVFQIKIEFHASAREDIGPITLDKPLIVNLDNDGFLNLPFSPEVCKTIESALTEQIFGFYIHNVLLLNNLLN